MKESSIFKESVLEDSLIIRSEKDLKEFMENFNKVETKKIVLLPMKRSRRYPYLCFLLFLKKRIVNKGFKVEKLFFIFPSFDNLSLLFPCDREILYFVETKFYQRLSNPLKFLFKKFFLKVFGPIFFKYPLLIILSK